jgi:hypothetical protein
VLDTAPAIARSVSHRLEPNAHAQRTLCAVDGSSAHGYVSDGRLQ